MWRSVGFVRHPTQKSLTGNFISVFIALNELSLNEILNGTGEGEFHVSIVYDRKLRVKATKTTSLFLKDDFATEPGFEHLGLHEVVDGAGQRVAINEDDVGELAGFEAAGVLLGLEEEGVVAGVEAQGFFAGEGVFDVDRFVEFACFAGDGGPHAEPGVVGIDAAEGADLLHVVAATTDDDFLIEAGAEGLKARHA